MRNYMHHMHGDGLPGAAGADAPAAVEGLRAQRRVGVVSMRVGGHDARLRRGGRMTRSRSRAPRLIVVSNRLPDLGSPGDVAGRRAASVGGLVSALRPALERAGRAVWVGWSGRTAKPKATRTRVGALEMVGIDLSEEDVEGHYNGFCNGALWPLLHCFPGRLVVERSHHARYRHVNEVFARIVARLVRPQDRIWVHDYHLIPLARALRRRGVVRPIGFFLHIPFPPHDVLALLPWAKEVLEDLAAYDVVGFHTPAYADNYAVALKRERVAGNGQRVGAFPIGIDPAPYTAWADERSARRRGRVLRDAVHGRKLILGVDRLDYTKGIVERLQIYERFLELHPRWRRRVSFVQISAPSRTRVAEYVRQRREVEQVVGRVNGRFGDTDWVPVRYLFRSYTQRELAAFYREADVGFVSPLRDGMNLVAKEYVASQTGDPGVLVLSRFAGAAVELAEAVIVNPYDTEGTARMLADALSMPLAERQRRQAALLARVEKQTAERWCASFAGALDGVSARRPSIGAGRSNRGEPVSRSASGP